ncbi:hypothetical protein PFISCL1PPCAC_12342, partial [Pristionchus fissidentatus]
LILSEMGSDQDQWMLHHTSRLSDDIIVTKSQYDDFSIPCPWRNFEIIVDNRALYVNPGWMAELSTFFQEACYGGRENEPVVIEDVKYEEMLDFLRCITFCPQRKSITVQNVSHVMKLASKFDMRPVMARCEQYVARTAPTLDRHRLFQVTCAMSHCDPNSSTMSLLVDRLAGMKEDELNEMQFHQMPGDVVAEVYSHKMKRRTDRRKKFCCVM